MEPRLQNWIGGTIVIIGCVLLQLFVQTFLLRLFERTAVVPAFVGWHRRWGWLLSLVTVFALIFGHLAQVALWTVLYRVLGEFTTVNDAVYFSLASYTTVGAAELELSRGHRMLGAAEAGVGVLMFGWSAAILVALVGLSDADRLRRRIGRE